jgi:hypothetical protein
MWGKNFAPVLVVADLLEGTDGSHVASPWLSRARDHRGLDGDQQAAGDRRRTRRAGAQRRMAARDFLVSRGMGEPISPAHSFLRGGASPGEESRAAAVAARRSRRQPSCGQIATSMRPRRSRARRPLGEDGGGHGAAQEAAAFTGRMNRYPAEQKGWSPHSGRHRNVTTNARRGRYRCSVAAPRGRRRSQRARRPIRAEQPTEDVPRRDLSGRWPRSPATTEQRQRHLARQGTGGICCTARCTLAAIADCRRSLRFGRIKPIDGFTPAARAASEQRKPARIAPGGRWLRRVRTDFVVHVVGREAIGRGWLARRGAAVHLVQIAPAS